MQIAQDISSRVQVKKRRRSGLRRGFFGCAIGEIDKSRCVSYFPIDPKCFIWIWNYLLGYTEHAIEAGIREGKGI